MRGRERERERERRKEGWKKKKGKSQSDGGRSFGSPSSARFFVSLSVLSLISLFPPNFVPFFPSRKEKETTFTNVPCIEIPAADPTRWSLIQHSPSHDSRNEHGINSFGSSFPLLLPLITFSSFPSFPFFSLKSSLFLINSSTFYNITDLVLAPSTSLSFWVIKWWVPVPLNFILLLLIPLVKLAASSFFTYFHNFSERERITGKGWSQETFTRRAFFIPLLT